MEKVIPLYNENVLDVTSNLKIYLEATFDLVYNYNNFFIVANNDPPYNTNSYPSFDAQNQYIGLNTPLDKIQHTSIDGKSPNPMDTNWGGHAFTTKLIDDGYYAEENVKIFIPD